jgi:arginase
LTPYFLDQPLPGLISLVQDDWELLDPVLPEGTTQSQTGEISKLLAQKIEATLERGERPISIAGDCCTSLGVAAGLRRSGIEPALIWFDAHGDFNTWETTPSGFLGGMPLAMLVGRGEQTIMDSLELEPLPESQVILTGARDLDPGEREMLEKSQVLQLTDVNLLLAVELPKSPIWVHFDTDVLDAHESPAQNYPVYGGPSENDLRRVFRHLGKTGMICAVSVSTWNPALQGAEISEAVSTSLLEELTGPYP